MTLSILLVEDHTLVRSGIRSLLDDSPEVKVVGEAGNGREAMELCARLNPDLILMDVEMRELNGIETTRRIIREHPETKVIMLSMYSEPQYVFESLRAGAVGYVLKDAAFNELLSAIRLVKAGRRYLSPPLTELVMEDYVDRASGKKLSENILDKLSGREREILQLVAEGRSSGQVAALLHISTRTVDAHRFNIMQKLGIHSIAGLTKFAIANGLTSVR
ncbi:MAG TPA: response regulator transcription factor [Phycisphaerae bacterium]|nr:response regulator transcription factor [Phycisphaerae bacterium]